MLNPAQCFFCISDDPWIFILLWCVTLVHLPILNHHCCPGISPTWSWWRIYSMHCCLHNFEYFYSYVHQEYWLWFFCSVCVGLVSVILAWCKVSLEEFLPIQFLGDSFRRICINYFLKTLGEIHLWSHLDQDFWEVVDYWFDFITRWFVQILFWSPEYCVCKVLSVSFLSSCWHRIVVVY